AYILADAPTAAPVDDEKKKAKTKEEPTVTRRKLKKKKVQFAEAWMILRTPFQLFAIGFFILCGVWLLHVIVLLMAFFAEPSYGVMVEDVLFKPKDSPADYEPGEYDALSRVPFAIGLLVGDSLRTVAQILYIVAQVLTLIQGGLWLTAYFMSLKLPNINGIRGQLITLITLGSINMLVGLVLKLLPLCGVMDFVQLPLAVPDFALSYANQDRMMPLQLFWAWHPFWATFFGLLF